MVASLGARRLLTAPTPLLLLGAGGFGREAAEAVRAVNAAHAAATGTDRWELLGFLDDSPALHGRTVSGAPVVGGFAEVERHPGAQIIVCTGHPGNFGSKRKIVERLDLPAERYATLVHPAAALAASCELGHGTVVLAGVVATVDVRVGAHVGVMPQVVLTHDDEVADYAILAAGVRLAGGVRIGPGAYIGSGALVREGREVGAGALVGMGAVVTRDVPAGEVWIGAPARFVRSVDPV